MLRQAVVRLSSYNEREAQDEVESGEDMLIELQGNLEIEGLDAKDASIFRKMHASYGLDIGEFYIDDRGLPHLIVGNSHLHGTIVKLEKPMMLIKKMTHQQNSNSTLGLESTSKISSTGFSNEQDVNQSDVASPNSDSVWNLVTVFYRKCLFKTRPDLVTNSS